MDLKSFWKSLTPADRERLAQEAGTSTGYLYLIALGHKDPSAKKAIAISDAAARIGIDLPRSALRPDIWDAA